MLSLATSEDQRKWDRQIPTLMFAYRSSIQETAGATPFKLMFGREARLPIDLQLNLPAEDLSSNNPAKQLENRLSRAYSYIKSHMQGAHKRQKLNYDKQATNGSYRVHDQVWLHNPVVPRGASRKLHCPWQGPFRIVQRIGNVLYKIQDEKKLKKCRVVHFNRLKPFRQRPESLSSPMPLAPRQSTSEEFDSDSDTSELESTTASSDSEDNSVDQANSPTRPSTKDNSNPDEEEVAEEPAPVLRRSTRQRRRPDWYGNVVTMQTSESELDD